MVPFIQTANDLSVALFVLIYQGSKAMHVIAGNELVDEVTHSRIRDEKNEKSKIALLTTMGFVLRPFGCPFLSFYRQ